MEYQDVLIACPACVNVEKAKLRNAESRFDGNRLVLTVEYVTEHKCSEDGI